MTTNYPDTCSVLSELISNIEFIEIIQTDLKQPGALIDTNTVNKLYIDILNESKVPDVKSDYKKKLKSIITENIPDITFNTPK